MKVTTDKEKIKELLTRGVEDIFIKENLEKRLFSGKQLRIKFGIDPTSEYIHLGRAVALRKLKAFQDLGHHIVLIIGDYTAKIGDPSDKLEKRPMLTDEQISNNLKKYLEQIAIILNMKNIEIRYNSEWLKKMSIFEIGELLECFTVQQMTKRRNFKERLDAGKDVFMVEFLYPALQGYDSVAVEADVEIGGFDQLFNLKAGRIVQKRYKKTEQDIMTLTMLEGTDGRKMSSSWGNIISIIDTPKEMFGKVMSLKDELITKYFLLTTNLDVIEIKKLENAIKEGKNPKNIKMKLAFEIIKAYHNEDRAKEAQEDWVSTFEKGEIPENVKEVENQERPIDVLVMSKIADSTSSARRLFDSGSVTDLTDGKKLTQKDEFKSKHIYRVGTHKFFKIK